MFKIINDATKYNLVALNKEKKFEMHISLTIKQQK